MASSAIRIRASSGDTGRGGGVDSGDVLGLVGVVLAGGSEGEGGVCAGGSATGASPSSVHPASSSASEQAGDAGARHVRRRAAAR